MHLKALKALNTLALKFSQIINGMKVIPTPKRRERGYIMHLRTHAMVEKLNVRYSRNVFSSLVTPMLLYEVEGWGSSIPKSNWDKFENVQKHFLTIFHQVKKQKSYVFLLKMGLFPIEIMYMEKLSKYNVRFKNSLTLISYNFMHLCVPIGCNIWKIMLEEGSHFILYTTYVSLYYKTIFFRMGKLETSTLVRVHHILCHVSRCLHTT